MTIAAGLIIVHPGRGHHNCQPADAMRRRFRLAAVPVVVAGVTAVVAVVVDVVTKWLADTRLPGAPVDLEVGRLQLSYTTGVASSLGDGLPTWAVLGLAGLITTTHR